MISISSRNKSIKKGVAVHGSGQSACCFPVIILLILMLVVVTGCNERVPDNIAAYVNDSGITMYELDMAMRYYGYADTDKSGDITSRRKVLNQLIDEKLICQEAEHMGIYVTGRELITEIERLTGDLPDEVFKEILIKEDISYDEWKSGVKRNLLIEKTTKAYLQSRVKLDHREWNEFFKSHKSVEPEPLKIKLSHITRATKKDIERVLEKVKKGKDFDKITEADLKNGDAPPAGSQWVYPHLLPEAIRTEVLKTSPGSVTGVVKTDYGYSIFKVMEIKESENLKPIQVMAVIKNMYLKDKADEVYADWLAGLRKNADIRISPELAVKDVPENVN